MHLNSPEIKQIALAAFPSYNGRSFQVLPFSPMRLTSCWDGGSRSSFVIIDLATLRQAPIPENGTPFSNGGQILQISDLPVNGAVVEHSIFCGKDMGIRIYVGESNLTKLLPNNVEISWEEKIVLSATRTFKSSYAGRKDNRFYEANCETGIARENWETAKANLIEKRLLNKAGAITNEGLNAIGQTSLYALKQAKPVPSEAKQVECQTATNE